MASPLQPFKASSCCRGYSIPHERVALRGFVVFSLAARTFSLRAVDLLAGWRRACPLHVAKTVSGALASNNTVSRCGRHTFHHPATGNFFDHRLIPSLDQLVPNNAPIVAQTVQCKDQIFYLLFDRQIFPLSAVNP